MTLIEQLLKIEELVKLIITSEPIKLKIGEYRIEQNEDELNLLDSEGIFFSKSHHPSTSGVLFFGTDVYVIQYTNARVGIHSTNRTSEVYDFEDFIYLSDDELFQYNVIYENFTEVHPALVYCIRNFINCNFKFNYIELIEALQNYILVKP